MTSEEAKANLEKLLLLYDDGMIDFHVIRESVKMAIEALQDSPTQMSGTSDLISRQTVIDLWEQYKPYIAVKACEYDSELRKLPFIRYM